MTTRGRYNVPSLKWRSFFERLRLLWSSSRMPQSRLEQIRLKLDRFSLAVARSDPTLGQITVPPVVIGAVEGSGTRILAQVLRKAGWFMSQRVDSRNEDSLPMAWFLTKWLKRLHDFPNVDSRTLTKATSDFDRMVQVHRRGIPSWDAPWGWKNPRTMWLLPFLVDRFPQMKFIHVIRDARDMILSNNMHFLKDHGYWMLGPEWWRDLEAAQLELWQRGNKRAVEFGERYLGDRYHMIRYEDLCQKPAETVTRLLEFLDAPKMNVGPLIEGIHDRGNIGRWRRAGGSEAGELDADVRSDLERFGYTA
jgi:Sulfotransferase family